MLDTKCITLTTSSLENPASKGLPRQSSKFSLNDNHPHVRERNPISVNAATSRPIRALTFNYAGTYIASADKSDNAKYI
jgi:hypothetical protein